MLYSLKKRTGMRDHNTKAQIKTNTKNKEIIPTPSPPPHPNPDIKQPPPKENRYKPGGTNVQSLYWLFTWQRK